MAVTSCAFVQVNYRNANHNNQFYNFAFQYIRNKHGNGCFMDSFVCESLPDMSILVEDHIIELLQERNDKAIALLYEPYGDTLFGVANKVVRDEELAQDVLQESFLKIWKKSDTSVPTQSN